ncbi:hypothetical protein AeNC1_018415, partial [Aphanomyces euteiches]
RGHDVMIATEQRLESLVVDEFKLPFRRIVGDICSGFFDPEHQRRLRAAKFFEALEIVSNWNSEFDPRAILNSYEAAVREADVVVSGVMSVTETYCLAEKYNVPWIPIFLGTVVLPTSAYPHWIFEDLMPSFLGCCLNRMTYSIIFRKMWQKQQVYINPWRVEVLKLPPIKESMGLLGKLTDSKSITVYQACSLLLASPTRALPHDYPPGKVDYVGYLFPSAESATVSPTLQAFLSASPDVPVIYIGFGSMPTLDPDQLFQLVVDLCRKANCRAVLVSGWSSLADMPSSDLVCVESSAPHAWLFPKMKCLIHHCGIGTTGGIKVTTPLSAMSAFCVLLTCPNAAVPCASDTTKMQNDGKARKPISIVTLSMAFNGAVLLTKPKLAISNRNLQHSSERQGDRDPLPQSQTLFEDNDGQKNAQNGIQEEPETRFDDHGVGNTPEERKPHATHGGPRKKVLPKDFGLHRSLAETLPLNAP